ncbi:MAG: 50S ribosomal protein L5 [Gammaproteobacteria bacterium]|nr:50S ribosomal protein L5 [Gammaproteobacteria bacterium]
MTRLLKTYQTQVIPHLMKQFGYTSFMQAPKVKKITLNIGMGEGARDKKKMEAAFSDLMMISGQKPVRTTAKKAIANFKIRKGWPLGCKVTLRKKRMYEFLDRLINIVLPRVRDFRGLSSRSFDGFGNYSFGVKEQIIFPEINYDKIDAIRGLDVTITTTANTDKEARALLEAFNFPFRT